MSKEIRTVDFVDGKVLLIDQTKLPEHYEIVTCIRWDQVYEAIKTMIVRGAPAIGVSAALGMALAANDVKDLSEFLKIANNMEQARPTAVNLMWAVDRIVNVAKNNFTDINKLREAVTAEAKKMLEEDIAVNKAIGRNGAELVPPNARILTHCNAGALATVAYGTALGVIRAAHEQGKVQMVYSDETRPRLQGGKLTAWELVEEGIPVTVITDNMAGYIMKKGMIDLVVVGADRIASNGDTANKIGTYSVAVLAKEHGIPFYIAAPFSTIDKTIKTGEEIPIEERDHEEVTHINGRRIIAEGVKIFNPGFDVTPARYITAIITEKSAIKPPFGF
jgi:methylthioribose-1-phosphate isomerase